jgi:hypothetical protein
MLVRDRVSSLTITTREDRLVLGYWYSAGLHIQ